MRQRHLYTLLGLSLLSLVGCGQSAPQEIASAPSPPPAPANTAPAPALAPAALAAGNGFVVDIQEGLLLTTARVAALKENIEVAFPVAADGKAVINPTNAAFKGGITVRAKVLIADPERDLAILQLESLPAEVPALKLAAASPAKDAALRSFSARADGSPAWVPATVAVSKVGPVQGSKSPNQMIELTGAKPFAPGAAGGVLVNEANEVVGVVPGETAAGSPVVCLDVSEVRPMLGAAYRARATDAYHEGKYDLAISYGDRALAAWPEDALGYNERGAAYSQKDQFDKAIADYTKAIEMEPGFPRAYRNRGSAYYHMGKYKEALVDCNRALELDSGYASAYQTRSKVYDKLKMAKEAEADQKAVVALADMERKGTVPPPDWKATTVTQGLGAKTNTGILGDLAGSGDTGGDTVTVTGSDGVQRTVRRGLMRSTGSSMTGSTGRRYVAVQPSVGRAPFNRGTVGTGSGGSGGMRTFPTPAPSIGGSHGGGSHGGGSRGGGTRGRP